MIEHIDVEQLTGFDDLMGDQHVLGAGRGVAWSRDKARCTSLDVYVSSSPSPNRTCTLSAHPAFHQVTLPKGRSVLLGVHRSALTSSLQLNSPVPFNLTAFLRHAVGFPDLGLLRRLRPTSSSSRRLAHAQLSELDVVPKFT
jgi:hypothetical protein